jgi:hypothetical protein
LSALLLLDGIFIFAFITIYRPPLLHYLVTSLLVIGLIWLARRLPGAAPPLEHTFPLRPRWFGLLGFLGTLGFFLLHWILPHTPVPPLVTMLLVLSLAALAGGLVRRASRLNPQALERQQWALVFGALGFFILIAPIQEFDASRPDNTSGMTLVGFTTLLFLIWLGRRISKRKKDLEDKSTNQPMELEIRS